MDILTIFHADVFARHPLGTIQCGDRLFWRPERSEVVTEVLVFYQSIQSLKHSFFCVLMRKIRLNLEIKHTAYVLLNPQLLIIYLAYLDKTFSQFLFVIPTCLLTSPRSKALVARCTASRTLSGLLISTVKT